MLRQRKNRRYNEETNDEEDDCGRKYDIHEQIRSERFDQIKDKHLQELPGDAITLKLIQRHGFEKPILVKEPNGLDLRVPSKNFHVRDVRNFVGHQRLIDVMDVRTQKNIEMSMKDWCKYYESRNRDRLLNVISLEFSHTKLDELVEAPMIVKLLDWVDLVWPKFLKESQTESTNSIDKMKYPKVQKYCLMSVKGSYTDFHIDFGGTSVWYHIIRGKKIFWMVPPTELNLQTFEEWTLSGMQQDVFFGDTVEECFRVELVAGNTFFIPSGWIHAVYTLEDSLVFGGNFLHSFGIENQLKVSKIEDATKVPIKFRYPFYTEILWYVVQHYVHCLTGKDHLHRPNISVNTTPEKQQEDKKVTKKVIPADDEATSVSEQESDNTGKRDNSSRKKRGKRTRQVSTKKSKKSQISDDDESTEIDSANEEDIKPAKSTNTCRMTKNSLLRLQYEIEDQHKQQPSNETLSKSTKPTKNETNTPARSKASSNKEKLGQSTSEKDIGEKQVQQQSSTIAANAPSLTDPNLARQDSVKLNGWSSNGGFGSQTSWSSSEVETKETSRIHITKTELNGLKALVKHLSKLSGAKKNLPTLIRNSRVLLDDCRKLLAEHENDDPELAVTGKPITLELLNPKKSDINQLIEQFFKPSDNTSSTGHHSPLKQSPNSIRSDSNTLTQQQRLKLNAIEERNKTSVASDGANKPVSPVRETKCLSPSKRLISSISQPTPTETSSSTPPSRPKSPPTRPIGNNQYTSKTKNDNNLLLPGSFADLIAATSTEKKVFEVSTSEVTSSLFGISNISSSPTPSKTAPNQPAKHPKDKERASNLVRPSTATMQKTSQPTIQTDNQTTSAAATEKHPNPNSPEPPKPSPQKRFINPAFRPQIKEKLVFASAPYVSPVSASDHSRQGGLYPWQSPAPQQQHHHHHHQQPQHQHPKLTTQSPELKNVLPELTQQQPQQPTYTPDISRNASPDKPDNQGQSARDKPAQQTDVLQQQATQRPFHEDPKPAQSTTNSLSPKKESSSNIKQPVKTKIELIQPTGGPSSTHNSDIPEKNKSKSVSPSTSSTQQQPQLQKEGSISVISSANPMPTGESDQKVKKVTKPRGPPKKSKEARLALESSDDTSASIPIIKFAGSNQLGEQRSVQPPNPQVPSDPASTSTSSKDKAEKPKVKRSKKKKDDNVTQNSGANPSAIPQTAPIPLVQAGSRPPLICGLVAPPVSSSSGAGASKMNPQQQYLLSRPLLFNTMPALTASQLQQMSRAPMLPTQVPSTLGLPPMQQGSRIVWATQPRGYLPTLISNPLPVVSQPGQVANPSSTKFTANPPTVRPPTTTNSTASHADNAALLSLATTALSTAPLPSSPALSQPGSGIRPQSAPRAIVVSSAGGQQPALFAGQQFLSSLVHRLPISPFNAVNTPGGAPRPATGQQLVFARLPNQQGQSRFLITQPGFPAFQRPPVPLIAGQSAPTMAFATNFYRPTAPAPAAKPMKAKKVKTS